MTKTLQRSGLMSLVITGGFIASLAARQTQQPPPATPAQPQITLAPGLNPVPDYTKTVADPLES